MKFICLAYQETDARLHDCLADGDEELRHGGHLLSCEILPPAEGAITIRVSQGRIEVTNGPPVQSSLSINRIYLVEARDLNHAIQLMSCHPGAKAGCYEIRAVSTNLCNQPLGLS